MKLWQSAALLFPLPLSSRQHSPRSKLPVPSPLQLLKEHINTKRSVVKGWKKDWKYSPLCSSALLHVNSWSWCKFSMQRASRLSTQRASIPLPSKSAGGTRFKRYRPSPWDLGWFWLIPFLLLLKSIFICLKAVYCEVIKMRPWGNFQKDREVNFK